MHRANTVPAYQATKEVWMAMLQRHEIRKRMLLSSRWVFPVYRAYMLWRLGEDRDLKRLLQEERPDIVVHPTVLEGVFVTDLVSLCSELGTPTLYIMNSWDNPSSKAMMLGKPDFLAVWGEQTRNHAQQFLDMRDEQIVVLGPAQFEAYRIPPPLTADEFKKTIGLEPSTGIILFAGSANGFEEVDQLELLDDAINSGELDAHVVFRPHPWRGSRADERDFHSCQFRHITMDPNMLECYELSRDQASHEERPLVYYQADYRDSHVVLNAADIVVSGISSMMLEAALIGRPVVCSVFDRHMRDMPVLNRVSKMFHFREFFEVTGSVRCQSEADLAADCRDALIQADQPGNAEALIERASYFAQKFADPYPVRLRELIDRILDGLATGESGGKRGSEINMAAPIGGSNG